MRKLRVCYVNELPPGSAKAVKWTVYQIAVFNVAGKLVAYEGLCKHMRAPLVTSGVCKDNILTCSWHGWQYDITTGNCIGKPGVALKTFPIVIENDTIFVEFDSN